MVDYTKIVVFEREKQLEAAVGRMDPDRKARFLALMNSHLEDGSGPIHGIIQTNGYGVDNFWDGNVRPDETDPIHQYFLYSVVCEIGSRINHRSAFCCSRVAMTHSHSISLVVASPTSPMLLNSPLSPWSLWHRGILKLASSCSSHTATPNNPPPSAEPTLHLMASHNASVLPALTPPRKPTISAQPTTHASQSTNGGA